MTTTDWTELAARLSGTLHLQHAPVAITFHAERPEGLESFDLPMSPLSEDGRSGRVPAGCVFWIHGEERTFLTEPADHGNCSVGRVTHGLAELGQVSGYADVALLLGSGWVDAEAVGRIPVVTETPRAISYGPLGENPDGIEPDVVLLRVNGRQLMVLSDALPEMSIEGKPQCHIVAIAKEQKRPAASVGCALSRQRTGMSPDEMTCALPAGQLAQIVDRIAAADDVDSTVAHYAAYDTRRFNRQQAR